MPSFWRLVRVADGFSHEPVYVRRFFKRELGFAETAVVFNIADLVSLGREFGCSFRVSNGAGNRMTASSFD